jgi:hypothetical protein
MFLNAVSYYVLWVAGPCLQAFIAVFMLKRRLYREYPLFFAYTLSHVVRFVVLFAFYHQVSKEAYRYPYFAAEVLDAALAFAAIYEVFSNVFRTYEGIWKLTGIVFRWALIVLVFVAVLTSAGSTGSDNQRILAGLFAFNQGVHIVRGGLLFLLILFCSYLGVRWNHFVFGIALGFALSSSVQLVAYATRAHLGPVGSRALSLISAAAYNCAVLVWLYYLLSPAPAERPAKLPSHTELDDWNESLLELIYR